MTSHRTLKKKCKDCNEPIYPEIQGYIRWANGDLLHIHCYEKQRDSASLTLS